MRNDSETVKKIETVQDFKRFLNNNRDKLLECTVRVGELPPEDEWIRDDEWDEVLCNSTIEPRGHIAVDFGG